MNSVRIRRIKVIKKLMLKSMTNTIVLMIKNVFYFAYEKKIKIKNSREHRK